MAVCFCEQAKSNKFHGDPLVNSSTNVFFEARSGQFFFLFVVFSSFSLFSLVYILQRFCVAFFSLLELSPLDSSDIPEAKNTTIEELTRRFQCTFANIFFFKHCFCPETNTCSTAIKKTKSECRYYSGLKKSIEKMVGSLGMPLKVTPKRAKPSGDETPLKDPAVCVLHILQDSFLASNHRENGDIPSGVYGVDIKGTIPTTQGYHHFPYDSEFGDGTGAKASLEDVR